MVRKQSADESSRLTVVREAGGQQVSVWAAALLGQVDGHPYVLHPPLHLCCAAGSDRGRRTTCVFFSFSLGCIPTSVVSYELDNMQSGTVFVPRRHHHRLPLPKQGKGVRDAPLFLTFSDLSKHTHITIKL